MSLRHFLLLFGLSILIYSCIYRTPSNIRFEKNTGLNLPDSIAVLQDRFEESGPDYGLFYKIQIKETDSLEILEQLDNLNDWKKAQDSLEYQKTNDGIIYNILILKDKNIIVYREELI